MGFLSNIIDSFTGSGGANAANQAGQIQADAAVRAAEIQERSAKEALEEIKRQFGITQDNIAPFMQAGTDALGSVISGGTVEGLDQTLNQIFNSDIFGSLVDERKRAVEGQLAAGGFMRSGVGVEEAARVPTDIGLAIEQLLFGRNSNLAGSGQNAAVGLGSLGADSSNSIANLLQQSGNAQANGITNAANANASGILGAQQARAAGAQNTMNLAASFAGFSDVRLKENIKQIGSIGKLNLYDWDWKSEFDGTIVSEAMKTGFLSSEVREHYPEYVFEFGGYDVIDYSNLIDKLESEVKH